MRYSIFVVALLAIILPGCSCQVQQYEITAAQKICADHDGLVLMDTFGPVTVRCNDGYVSLLTKGFSQ